MLKEPRALVFHATHCKAVGPVVRIRGRITAVEGTGMRVSTTLRAAPVVADTTSTGERTVAVT